jgi:hypothetical protein
MKKFLVVLLSLGLIVAFSATASAQPTVKFGGSYYLVGVYESNPQLTPKEAGYLNYSHRRHALPVPTSSRGCASSPSSRSPKG